MKNGLRFFLLGLASLLLGIGMWLISEKPDVKALAATARSGVERTVDAAREVLFTPVPEVTPTPAPTEIPQNRVDASNRGLSDDDLAIFAGDPYLVELNLLSNDLTAQGIDALASKLPNCDIRWSVPIGGQRFDSAMTDITLPADTSEAELYDLRFFQELQRVDGRQTAIGEAIYDYSFGRADVEFRYAIDIGGVKVEDDAETCSLAASTVTVDELPALVHMLRKLKAIDFTGRRLPWEELDRLQKALPNMEITADVEIYDVWYPDTTEMLDLSGAAIGDIDDLTARLSRLTKLSAVDVTGTELTEEAYNALASKRPDVHFVRTVSVGGFTVRTDIRAFSNRMKDGSRGVTLTGKSAELTGDDLANLKYCPELVALEIDDESHLGDLTALKELKGLRYLKLNDCNLEDITPLGELGELVLLDLHHNLIGDFSALKKLTKLEELNVSTNLPPSGDVTREELSDGKLEALMQMTWLDRLWCLHNSFDSDEIKELTAALPETLAVAKDKRGVDAEWEDGIRVKELHELLGDIQE